MWLDRRAELEKSTAELDAARSTANILAMQLKSSRCAEEDEHSAYADLRNRVETSQASKREMLTSIGEDTRAVSRNTELLRFLLAMTHTEDWNQVPDEFLTRNVVLDLNYNESAALIDAHVKRCKLRNEADIVATQSSIDWSTRSAPGATSPVKDQGQFNSILAGCIQRQKELSQLCSRFKERWLRFQRNRSFLVTQPILIAMEAIFSQFSTM